MCRSCEHSKKSGTRRTKTITVENVAFRQGNQRISNPALFHTASTVSITFIQQKNHLHYGTVTQHNNKNSRQNPVTIQARIVNRVLKYPAPPKTPLNAFFNPTTKQSNFITSDQILKKICWACDELGVDNLGYSANEVGCHSIRSGATIGMYLKYIKTFTIMLQGRWCNNAFLRYIRKH